jgi:hypothetical protein
MEKNNNKWPFLFLFFILFHFFFFLCLLIEWAHACMVDITTVVDTYILLYDVNDHRQRSIRWHCARVYYIIMLCEQVFTRTAATAAGGQITRVHSRDRR